MTSNNKRFQNQFKRKSNKEINVIKRRGYIARKGRKKHEEGGKEIEPK